MTIDRVAEVISLWDAHMRAAFPSRLRGIDVEDVDMVMLDATVAGCVTV